MRKLLTLIATMIMCCNAYGENEKVVWFTADKTFTSTTCTRGGNVNKRSDPTKEGYRFIGWAEPTNPTSQQEFLMWLLQPQNFESTPTSYTPTATGVISTSWSVEWSGHGTISGGGQCFTGSGTFDSTNGVYTSTTSVGTNGGTECWCKVSAARGADGNGMNFFINGANVWTYKGSYSSSSNCVKDCPYKCVVAFRNILTYRKELFGLN